MTSTDMPRKDNIELSLVVPILDEVENLRPLVNRILATFDTLGPVATQYIGMTIHFAFTTAGTYDFVSNPVGVVIEP